MEPEGVWFDPRPGRINRGEGIERVELTSTYLIWLPHCYHWGALEQGTYRDSLVFLKWGHIKYMSTVEPPYPYALAWLRNRWSASGEIQCEAKSR